jgi:predicted HTH domain antitoxin
MLTLALFLGYTRQEFIHKYDKSIYEVRLEVAIYFYERGETPEDSFKKADEFLTYLKTLKK